MDKLLLRPEEVAEITGLGRTKIYDLLSRGEIESVTCGRRRLIPADAVETFVAHLREEGARPVAVEA